MAQTSTTGSAPPPMSVRVSAWAVYEIFETRDEEQVFVGVVSDGQWKSFCDSFQITEFIKDKEMDLNAGRVGKRDIIIPKIQDLFKTYDKVDLMKKLDETGLPFAPISKPEDLFDDEHLNASDGLIDIKVPYKDMYTKLPSLPIEMNNHRFGLHHPVPEIGEHSKRILKEIGFDEEAIEDLFKKEIVS